MHINLNAAMVTTARFRGSSSHSNYNAAMVTTKSQKLPPAASTGRQQTRYLHPQSPLPPSQDKPIYTTARLEEYITPYNSFTEISLLKMNYLYLAALSGVNRRIGKQTRLRQKEEASCGCCVGGGVERRGRSLLRRRRRREVASNLLQRRPRLC
nr:hypothetical protein Iba_chr10bCG7480 [Ipomoea batatas]